jgi:hypothetical protein
MESTEGESMDMGSGFSGPGTLAAYATASLLFPASYQVGSFLSDYRLPRISGYLMTGVRFVSSLIISNISYWYCERGEGDAECFYSSS